MVNTGIYILTMVLVIGRGDVIYKPYAVYTNPQECFTMRPIMELALRVPMSCIHYNEFQEKGVKYGGK